jgi:mannose-1-phosphate guanylyltransferase
MPMSNASAPWVVVLAAGEGTRLRTLTTDAAGRSMPKQYCSLRGGPTLLDEALQRARGLTTPQRVLAVVAARHEGLWTRELGDLACENVIAQPGNRGTAAGLLLPLLTVLERDPAADLVVLPSDHHVADEAVLRTALLEALESARRSPQHVTLLGLVPDRAETDYGWIVPRQGPGRVRHVARFVEKPEAAVAARLLEAGGLWNGFLFAGGGRALIDLFARRAGALLTDFKEVFEQPPAARVEALRALYERVRTTDLSSDLMQGSEERLLMLEVPPCGWTDLGTPERVEQCLARVQPPRVSPPGREPRPAAPSLEQALAERERSFRRRVPQRA